MICITGHFERRNVKAILEKTVSFLKKNSAAFEIGNIETKKFNSKKFSCIIVIGGDGSLLRVCRELKFEIPIIGIASGEKSFLMQIKPVQMERQLKKIVQEKFRIEKRARLSVSADSKKLPLALNEALLVNKKSGSIIKYCIKVNGKKISEARADGVIVCTPTGSTGHALSAGGKKISSRIGIVQYNIMGKKQKPIIVGKNSKIQINCLGKFSEYEAVIDGQPRFEVKKSIILKKGKSINFVKLN